MAEISFWSDSINIGSSGVAFYNSGGFGQSLPIGTYNGRTYASDSTGTTQGAELNNCKYISSSGVILGQSGSGIHLLQVPNYQATLNIRFEHGSAVQTQNAVMYGYDRVDTDNAPSGFTLQAAEIIHPGTTQVFSGSGDAAWTQLQGSGSTLSFIDSPGTSGERSTGGGPDVRNDFYATISATPDSTGSKTFAIQFSLEFL